MATSGGLQEALGVTPWDYVLPVGNVSTGGDSASINAALAAGKPVLLEPNAKYYLESQINVPNYGRLEGICGDNAGEIVSDLGTTQLIPIASFSDASVINFATRTQFQQVREIEINGTLLASNNTVSGVFGADTTSLLTYESHTVVEFVYVHGLGGYCFYQGAYRRWDYYRRCTGYGLNTTQVLLAFEGTDSFADCMDLGGGGYCVVFAGALSSIYNSAIFGAALANVLYSSGCLENNVINCGIDSSAQTGIYVTGGTDNAGCIIGNSLHNNGTSANNSYSDIYVAATCKSLVIANNTFGIMQAGQTNKVAYCIQVASGGVATISGNALGDPSTFATGFTNYTTINWWEAKAGDVLQSVRYAPTSSATYTITTGLAAVDTTNLTISFVAPASGTVKIRASIYGRVVPTLTTGDEQYLNLIFVTHSTTNPVSAYRRFLDIYPPSASQIYVGTVCVYEDTITTLTPGTTYQFDLAAKWGGTATAQQVLLIAQSGANVSNDIGPAILEAVAA